MARRKIGNFKKRVGNWQTDYFPNIGHFVYNNGGGVFLGVLRQIGLLPQIAPSH